MARFSRAFMDAALSGGGKAERPNAMRGLLFEPLGRPLPRGWSAGPNTLDGIPHRACARWAALLGPWASSEDVEAEDGGCLIVMAAMPNLNWRGSGSILMGLSILTGRAAGLSSLSPLSTTNSTLSASDSLTSAFMGRSGARGRRVSSARDRRGGRRDDVSGGAEQ